MNFLKTIAKGIVISFLVHFLFAAGIIKLDFNVSMANFSVILFLLMAIISLYVGFSSKKFGAIAGTIVSIGTVGIILLYLNQRIEMNWELNRYIIGAYLINGFVFSLIGSAFGKKDKNKDKTKKTVSPAKKEAIKQAESRREILQKNLKKEAKKK